MNQFYSKSKIVKILIFFFLTIPLLTFSQVQIGDDIHGEDISDYSGGSISLSSDGSIVAIGADRNNGNGSNSGHVRVYENTNGVWIQLGDDIDGEANQDKSGSSVSLSSDGSIVAIGAQYNDGNGNQNGHVRIFKNESGVWTQIGSDIDGEAEYDWSGSSVSLSSDGSIVAIGAGGNDGNGKGNFTGHVRIFKNELGVWTQIGSDIDGEAESNWSGESVSLSSNGSIVAIGAIGNEGSGHVRIFKNELGVWTQIGNDINGEANGDNFGSSVSLSSDGSIVAIGAQYNDGNGNQNGHVRVYENMLGNWIQIGSDIDGKDNEELSGGSISISSDGSIIAIGAKNNSENGEFSGKVRIYKNITGVWTQIGSDLNGEGSGDFAGISVSLSSDGSIIALGAIGNSYWDNTSYIYLTGAVRVFDLSATLSNSSLENNYFTYYPNPVENILNVKVIKGLELKQINIYNIQSQYLYSVRTSKIDVTNLSSGIYFFEVETNQGKSVKKILIE
ncbi:T9SS type A sorting domain-containing protein [Algibacter sp. Ld11]|uniref:T9SS type A sorting domain-containing protein n=1 Tax=Algibacter sp. Ld11 TaxID=649150 RepID=UPI003865F6E9